MPEQLHNPDVLNCLANLSSDEVFTPPDVVNAMLDMLPPELWCDKKATFLDPACKSGVFLREIAKRLIEGLKSDFPNLQERLDHIFQKQLYGIAMTELTALLSRRSLYGSKWANGKYSFSHFATPAGNIYFCKSSGHTWERGRCSFCGAAQGEYDRDADRESHAYEFIHTTTPEKIFDMKFDVIIGNPPYQLDTGGNGKQAKPIYHLFVEQSKKIHPRYIIMIIPSRWFSGGMGLDKFRKSMLSDNHLTKIVDFINAKDCFPQNSISGGVCYFLYERDRTSLCEFTNFYNNKFNTLIRNLNEFEILIRHNPAINIIKKLNILDNNKLSSIVSPISPFGIPTNFRDFTNKQSESSIKVYSSSGSFYIEPHQLQKGHDYLQYYNVMISQTSSEHAGEPSKDGKYKVISSSINICRKNEACTHSYLLLGKFSNEENAKNLLSYLKTYFVRFLILQSLSSIHITKSTFSFVPIQDFSKPWTDKELYTKYGLDKEEIDFIESMIKPM
ncbi:MAG: Eco57I restriction-modification methylase domain-containing protein [Desulfovibrionaceae bacterium]